VQRFIHYADNGKLLAKHSKQYLKSLSARLLNYWSGSATNDQMWHVLTSQNNSPFTRPNLISLTQLNVIKPLACPSFSLCRKGVIFPQQHVAALKCWQWSGRRHCKGAHHLAEWDKELPRQHDTYIKMQACMPQHLPWVSVNTPQAESSKNPWATWCMSYF